ncbi:MAG: thrombospondin type 3 repeat-containing protein [Pseudomonadales bacterium]
MTNAERAASILKDGDLVWTGAKASAMSSLLSAGVNAGRVQLFAPSAYQGGSSTSHFDDAVHYDSDADEVMEPQYEFPNESVMASAAFCDMGWLLARDSDSDGIDDCQDDEPLSPPPPDTDGDGVSDNLDAFPNNDAAAVDTDGDGMPDAWLPGNPYGCAPNAATCNGLTLDTDSDNDGVADATDNCPFIANADQKDYNSNGQGDACDPLPMPSVNGKVTKDRTGSAVAFAGDFNGDGYGDYIVGSPGFDVAAVPKVSPVIKDIGRIEIISGKTGLSIFSLTGSVAKDGFGTAVAGNVDVNNDGIADVVVGAPLADDVGNGLKNVGMISVIYGCAAPCAVQHEERYGTETNAMFGAAVALGYFNNDDNADVAVGAPKAVNAQGIKPLKQAGAVMVLSGSALQATPLLEVFGKKAKAKAGTAVALGVWDASTPEDELMVGAPYDDDTDNQIVDAGSVRVYSLSDGTDEIFFEFGDALKDYFGAAIATGGDIDTDGLQDWVIGMPGADAIVNGVKKKNAGGVRVFRGSNTSLHPELDPLLGVDTNGALGASVALADINNDVYADIIVGAPKAANPTAVPKAIAATGSVRIYSMVSGSLQLLASPLYGEKKGDLFGASVSAGDIDGDGKADLIIGIPGQDVPSIKLQKDAGGVDVVSGAALQ